MAVRVDARCAFSCASLERTASSALPTNTVVSLPFPFPSRLPWVLSVFLSLHCLCEFQKKKKHEELFSSLFLLSLLLIIR